MDDKISRVKDEIEEDKIELEVVTDLNEVSIAVRTTDESEFSLVGLDQERNETLGSFFRTYQKIIKEIYKLHKPETTYDILPEKDTIEWCWEVGRYLAEGLGERTKQEKKVFIAPLGEKDEDISKWKVLRTEEIYELYPNKEDLPDINVEEGSASVFAMTCRVCDSQQELEEIYMELDPSEMKYMEYKMWRDLREESEVGEEQIRELAEHHDNNGASKERKEKAVERVSRIV